MRAGKDDQSAIGMIRWESEIESIIKEKKEGSYARPAPASLTVNQD